MKPAVVVERPSPMATPHHIRPEEDDYYYGQMDDVELGGYSGTPSRDEEAGSSGSGNDDGFVRPRRSQRMSADVNELFRRGFGSIRRGNLI